MSTPENPPPAPDWILGEDGHWRPPPFTSGPSARPTGPAGPPPIAPPPPPAVPGAAAWGQAPPAGWVPPAPPRSQGTTVAMVLGGVALLGVLGVAVLVGAVTFLGTTAEPKFEKVDMASDDQIGGGGGFTQIPMDDEDDPAAPDTTAPLSSEPDADIALSEKAALAAADRLVVEGADWLVTDVEEVAPDAGVGMAGACFPDGWLTGATDRFRTYYGRRSTGNPEALTLSFTTYESDTAAFDELARVGSDVYRACEVQERLGEVTSSATDATVTALAPDPAAPGVIYQVDLVGGGDPLTKYVFAVFVGRQRAHLDFCGCLDLPYEDQLAIARQVAAAMAEAQGLPAPG